MNLISSLELTEGEGKKSPDINRHGVILDYIELFVYESACHCLQHGIMHTEVYRQSRVNETSPE